MFLQQKLRDKLLDLFLAMAIEHGEYFMKEIEMQRPSGTHVRDCRLLLIYQAMYCRAIRTHFAFSLSTVQTKVCKLTSSDLNIYTNVHRSVSRTCTSFIQLDKCVSTKAETEQYCPSKARFGCLNVWLLIFRKLSA